VLKVSTFIASVAFYFLLLLFFSFYFLHKDRFKKVEVKAQSIDILVLEEKPKKNIPIHQPNPKKSSIKKRPHSGPPSPKQKTPSIKNLFSSLDAKKFQTQEPKPQPIPQPSRFKERESAKTKELVDKLTFKEFVPLSQKSIKSVSGKRDPYLEEIYRILYSYWVPSQASAGGEAIVEITIDTNGDFDYKILKLSNNEIFNQELEKFLEKMRTTTFPAPSKTRVVKVRFEAKD